MKTPTNKKAPEDHGQTVLISSLSIRRRAGMKFGPVAIKVSMDDLNEDQWEALNSDPAIKIQGAKPERAERPIDEEKLKAAINELVEDGTKADKITVAQMSEKVGQRVKKSEFESFVQAELNAA